MKKHLCGVAVLAVAQLIAMLPLAAQAGSDSYFEFGTVVAVGRRDIDVQSYDPQRGRTVQKTFTFTKDTRADVVRVGDSVEVIYSPAGMDDNGTWMLRRLLMLTSGVPKSGPPPAPGVAGSRSASANATALPPPAVPGKKSVGLGKTSTAAATKAAATSAAATPTLGKNGTAKPAPGVGAVTALPKAPVALPAPPPARVPGVATVQMGASTETVKGMPPKVKDVASIAPGQECNRSDTDWSTSPIKLAVLDFRYPTEREEAHNVGSTGGGSGTAVADLIYTALDGNPRFQLMRGDRQKLFRMDFAGAARTGRELGADAVLLGTFNPVQAEITDPSFPPPVEGYSLRAGVVDTCTGQLLYRLTSISCPSKTVGAEGDARTCPGSQVSVKVAPDPIANQSAYQGPITTLLAPLDGKVKPPEAEGAIGVVTSGGGGTLSIKLIGNNKVRVDQELSVHAARLAKNPTTYTLRRYQDEEIGRLIIHRISGNDATGTYGGDVIPAPGDSVYAVIQ